MNDYLAYKKRALRLKGSYCHGLSLLWLYKSATGRQRWFDNLVNGIITRKDNEIFDAREKDIEYFISLIEWIENPDHYVRHVNQLDMQVLTELTLEKSASFILNSEQVHALLSELIGEKKPISLSSRDHTIGIYRIGDTMHLFDSRYPCLKPKLFSANELSALKKEIVKRLFRLNHFPVMGLPLHIFVFAHPDALMQADTNKSKQLFDRLLETSPAPNDPGLDGVTNLHLACESGNRYAVRQLLKRGANPNVYSYQGTPLHVAANKGYFGIARTLLHFGAHATVRGKNAVQPIEIAEQREYASIVKLLR